MTVNKFNINNKQDRDEFIQNFWLNLDEVHNIKTRNIIGEHSFFNDNPPLAIVDLMSRPENFGWTVSVLFGIDLHPLQVNVLKLLWNHPFSILTASRGGSKSFSLAIYALLRALFIPNTKVMFIGSAFRQSKIIFTYCENIYYKSPMLQDVLGSTSNKIISHNVDMFQMKIYDSTITSIPLGTGDKIRGQRSTCTISDEHNSLNEEIYQEVIQGFSAVSLNPIEQVQERAKYEAMLALGEITQEKFLEIQAAKISNQQIISGTCGYVFQPLYKVWKRYHDIILSRGDEQKVRQIFNDELPMGFNHKDYAIARLPQDIYPKGYIDEKSIGRAKATTHSGIYNSEYMCCTLPETKIITSEGIKQIINVSVGDLVLTHKGRFRKVLKTIGHDYIGNMVSYKTKGFYDNIDFTSEHPFWIGDENWDSIENVFNNTKLAKIVELNNNQSIDLKKYTSNIIQINDKIFPKPGMSKIKTENITDIFNAVGSVSSIAKKFNESYNCVYSIKHMNQNKKGSLPINIPLNYNFGLILGYYAAEGSCGSRNKSVVFYLDGHKETSLEYYVKELSEAIFNIFGIKPKVYFTENLACVTINSRILVDLIKKICPGKSYEKIIEHDILFSNKELIKGFITGYWNGDGHLRKDRTTCSACSVSESLLYQVKLCLSLFNVPCSLGKRAFKKAKFRNKIYNTHQAYNLLIYGQAAILFKKLFYNIEADRPKILRQYITADEEAINYPIIEHKKYHYNGKVYNLEVEEDNSYSTLNATVHNCFITDSQGFFKRTLIENATCGRSLAKLIKKCGEIDFTIMMEGHRTGKYVMGVDPASQTDNFAVVILEIWEDHRRVVHSWTTNNYAHKMRLKHGLISEHNYYNHCARKIRDLMRWFNIEEIAIDAQGGGRSIAEILGDPNYLNAGEHPLYPIPDLAKPLQTDHLAGRHILHMIEFSNTEWVYNANHNLKQDIETRELLFPSCSSADFGLLHDMDVLASRVKEEAEEIGSLRETAEDVLLEIEELKNELVLIEHTQTPSGRDKWDTPQVKGLNSKKGRLRKDRYSALLLANAIGRSMIARTIEYQYDIMGGFAHKIAGTDKIKSKEIPDVSAGFSFGVGVRRR